MGMGVGSAAPFRVSVHDACEVLNTHLGGSVSRWRKTEAQFFQRPLYSFSEEVGKNMHCFSHGFLEYDIYGSELSLVKYPEVCGVVFGL
jgi:hypothetical protein